MKISQLSAACKLIIYNFIMKKGRSREKRGKSKKKKSKEKITFSRINYK